jgi:Na+/H+ antiporter NhaD/arsenite permease-like protein
MEISIILVFVLGYLAIALEHPLHVDKAASALILGVMCWALFVLGVQSVPEALTAEFSHFIHENSALSESEQIPVFLEHRLLHHISEIASILFFLMGAMTIVELVDAHEGFRVITDRIKTTNKAKLLWILSILTFFLSAVLDNLTTTIVMISLLRKLIADQKTRWFFVGFVVIAANAGGAWSPIGDVTTTMLWIKKQLPDVPIIIVELFIPSLMAVLVPLTILSFMMKGEVTRPERNGHDDKGEVPITDRERNFIFVAGIMGLLFVPVFKTVTHLPPFMGMMLSLGILWLITEIMHKRKLYEIKRKLSVLSVLRKIDTSSVLFFLGILLGVSALQEVGILGNVAAGLDRSIGNIYAINVAIGLLSAIVDNVPLVAAAQGMYPIAAEGAFAPSGDFWLFLAYCAGTGGSALIIGSAAGVAAMGLERIDFIWYLKNLTWLAVAGYASGAAVFILTSA